MWAPPRRGQLGDSLSWTTSLLPPVPHLACTVDPRILVTSLPHAGASVAGCWGSRPLCVCWIQGESFPSTELPGGQSFCPPSSSSGPSRPSGSDGRRRAEGGGRRAGFQSQRPDPASDLRLVGGGQPGFPVPPRLTRDPVQICLRPRAVLWGCSTSHCTPGSPRNADLSQDM